MNSIKVILVSLILFFHCDYSQIKNNKYNESLSKLIFSNYDLKSKLIKTFELNKKEIKVFKVLISRRNQFVRISIFKIIDKEELNEFPSSYFTFKSNTFLCYDGSEIISNNRLDKEFVDKVKSKLASNVINDSRVFQFDLDSEEKVILHNPAINPYDLNEKLHKVFP
jgi:hypothetical protein